MPETLASLSPILFAVAANVLAVALAVGVWLAWRTYTTTDQRRVVRLAVGDLVRAAEQMGGDNEARLAFVMDNLTTIFPKISPAVLELLIEAAVYELNLEEQQIAQAAQAAPRWTTADAFDEDTPR